MGQPVLQLVEVGSVLLNEKHLALLPDFVLKFLLLLARELVPIGGTDTLDVFTADAVPFCLVLRRHHFDGTAVTLHIVSPIGCDILLQKIKNTVKVSRIIGNRGSRRKINALGLSSPDKALDDFVPVRLRVGKVVCFINDKERFPVRYVLQ